jgi:hypothetical protein
MALQRFTELPLSAQTAYAELAEQTRTFELTNALAGLVGSFQKLKRGRQTYWYFAYRDLDRKVRLVYVGPDDERVRKLVERFERVRRRRPLAPQAQAALALGCGAVAPKHFRIIKRLSEYGFFGAGGILIGTHAFVAMGNLLGVRWNDGLRTLDVDFVHAGRNISVALPADVKIDVHRALESLEMGLLPLSGLDGRATGQNRNPADPELRIDFVTSSTRGTKAVRVPNLNLSLQPLKFMELSLAETTQACIIGRDGACTVNLPAPERYAVHKLIVFGERPPSERAKANKDLLQVASLASYFAETGRAKIFNELWREALNRGKGWSSRARNGREALLRIAPDLDLHSLWRA